MDMLTRRRFLVASGVVGAATLATGAVGYRLSHILETAGDRPSDARTLVLVTLYGGNDGLNTVIPYADPAYHDARPDLAYRPEEVLHLDKSLGLNPGMTGFKRLFDAGRLAIVRGIGYPKPDHSHFRSMDIWQTGQPDRPGNTGWLGRWLDATGGDPRHAVSFEPVLPPVLAGATTAGAAVALREGGVSGAGVPARGPAPATLAGFGTAAPGEPPLQARAARAYADLVSVDAMVGKLAAAPAPSSGAATDDNQPKATGTGGRTALSAQLDLVARCVEANVATRAFSVSLGGFDTHADEKIAQRRQLSELDSAVTAFADRMARTDAGRKVVVAVYSEFGRRVRANASDGTDHGTASDLFVLGSPVRGGFYGRQPSLTDLDDGDLKFTTDFRDAYASLLDGVLHTDPGKVLGGWSGRIDGLLA
ncbi:DUF1501 domain-containing protein [Planosporangium mesophilum]|uniref:DUF1501 domain-containing protein n=1 Tax=Planosporangium mesophilum TaxID=689768 RepID=A0A8J3TCS6_9ACTN|nr:DUF1501 domain-containing protein [Planosporangium mesophilum]NJC84624.1 DUF1501 domain-containing protein [Planosporangium mesophilum]GII23934.1 hypothetical protein Pme01_35310 [Planosporangium mesophilum]